MRIKMIRIVKIIVAIFPAQYDTLVKLKNLVRAYSIRGEVK